jgi:hypothetical protein
MAVSASASPGQYIIGTQIYGKLRHPISAAAEGIAYGTDCKEVFQNEPFGRAYGKQEIDPINSRLSPFWELFGTGLHIHKRLALRYDRPGFIIQSLLQTAYIFWFQDGCSRIKAIF